MKDSSNNSSIIKLAIWLVFIIILVIMVKVNSKNNSDTETNDDGNVSETLSINNLNNNYKYNYLITINNEVYNYVGSKKDNKESGYLLHNGNYLYYYIENNNTYEIIDHNLIEINNLYDSIDSNLIDISYIKNEVINNNDYIVNIEELESTIVITIEYENNIYKLEYSDINLVDNIEY